MSFTIGMLARASGVHVETVRYYQRRGLMAEPGRPLGSIRRYGDQGLRRPASANRARGEVSGSRRSQNLLAYWLSIERLLGKLGWLASSSHRRPGLRQSDRHGTRRRARCDAPAAQTCTYAGNLPLMRAYG